MKNSKNSINEIKCIYILKQYIQELSGGTAHPRSERILVLDTISNFLNFLLSLQLLFLKMEINYFNKLFGNNIFFN